MKVDCSSVCVEQLHEGALANYVT